MGWSHRAIASVAGLAVSVALALPAVASELLVMPFACSVIGGAAQLTPSDDRGYAVIGPRDAREFSFCSPSEPELCKRWKIFRFDVDCGGARVPWMSLAASARRDGRAWLDSGRMKLQLPAGWRDGDNDICDEPVEGGYGWRRRGLARFCARRAAEPGPVVEFPAGYAPMIGLDAIFVADGAPQVPAGRPHDSSERARLAQSGASGASAPGEEKATKGQDKNSRPDARPAVTAPRAVRLPQETGDRFQEHSVGAESGAPAPAAKSTSATAAQSPPSVAQAASGLSRLDVRPAVINRPAVQDRKPAVVAASEPAISSAPATADVVTASIARPVGVARLAAPPGPWSPQLPRPLSLPMMVAGGILGTLAGLAFLQWRSRGLAQITPERDIGGLRLGGARAVAIATPLPSKQSHVRPSGVRESFASPSGIGADMPETFDEALRILGMGVRADVSDAALKKIVDGLRMSWHPDGAQTGEERELRELRTKQINAAWDIIAAKRRA